MIEAEMSATDAKGSRQRTRDQLLTFKVVGVPISIDELENEFELMRKTYGKNVGAEEVGRIAAGSGTHLLKLITPVAEKGQAVVRVAQAGANGGKNLLPSVNAPDIPIAKILFRPLEIVGRQTRSLVEHILAPDDASPRVFHAFSCVFGEDVLAALKDGLKAELPPITQLPAENFPIIFVPHPGGGDLQITPLSPASAYMGIKDEARGLAPVKTRNGKEMTRGWWDHQAVTSKPQNISGAIGGPRWRFLAEMPAVLQGSRAEVFRFAKGGRFPRLRSAKVMEMLLAYAERLERFDSGVSALRSSIDQLADGILEHAMDFAETVIADARLIVASDADAVRRLSAYPPPSSILNRMPWKKDDIARARSALLNHHFAAREKTMMARRG